MTNLVDHIEALTDEECDIIIGYMKPQHPNLYVGTLPFLDKEMVVTKLTDILDLDSSVRNWDTPRKQLHLRLVAKLTGRKAEVKQEHARVMVYLYDENGLVAKVASDSLKHGKKKAAHYVAGYKVYIKMKHSDVKGFNRNRRLA